MAEKLPLKFGLKFPRRFEISHAKYIFFSKPFTPSPPKTRPERIKRAVTTRGNCSDEGETTKMPHCFVIFLRGGNVTIIETLRLN